MKRSKEPELACVTCTECGNEQSDMGRNVECEECGYGPMPSPSSAQFDADKAREKGKKGKS